MSLISRTPYLRVVVLRVFLPAALIMSMPFGAFAEGWGYLDVAAGYKTGDFGTPTKSDLYYLSPTLGYVAPAYDVSLTAPYLSLASETGDISTTESGIGDIILRGGAVLLQESTGGLSVVGSLAFKLPSADETAGLGTGEADYGAFFSLHQRFDEIKLSFMAGYILIGDPPLINYNDVYLYGAGVSKMFGRTDLFVSLEGRRSMVSGADDPREVNLGFFHILDASHAIKGSAFTGLNDGGPDFGLAFGFVRRL